jgi:outer membrane lipoprotein-sorting protein
MKDSKRTMRRLHAANVHSSELKHLTLYLMLTFICLMLASCAAKKTVVAPVHEGVPLEKALADLQRIKTIEASLAVDYEKGDTVMSGDAGLTLSAESLNLRLYYLGFLAGELKEEHGHITVSKPRLDKNRTALLVQGLRNGFLWWNIRDYAVTEDSDQYVLRNSDREILINKKLLLPTQQSIRLENGDEIIITYDVPDQIDDSERIAGSPPWMHYYQSQMKIELKNYLVKVKIKAYMVK